MLGRLLLPEIEELVRKKEFRALKEVLGDLAPADLADLIGDLEESDLVVVFRLLPKDRATEVFEYLDFPEQEMLLASLKSETVRQLLEDMSPDDRTALLEELPPRAAQRLIGMISEQERRVATMLLNYPEESVGRLMTPDFIYLRPEMTAQDALAKIRRIGIDRETVYVLYVVDRDLRLRGFVSLRRLVTAPLDLKVDELMNDDVVQVQVNDDQEVAAEKLRRYGLIALPVVDQEGKLVGIVTFDDILDLVEAEHTEDVQMQAAVLPDEEHYLDVRIRDMIKRRAPWLLGLLAAESLVVVFLERYDSTLHAALALAFFVPVLVATGGNTGTQSAALVIRALATGEAEISDAWRIARRDLLVGALLSVALGLAAFILAMIVNGDGVVALCVALGLAAIVNMSNMTGTLLPIVFKKFGMDPALMSGPFISTIMDLLGLVVYMEISVRVLRAFHHI